METQVWAQDDKIQALVHPESWLVKPLSAGCVNTVVAVISDVLEVAIGGWSKGHFSLCYLTYVISIQHATTA